MRTTPERCATCPTRLMPRSKWKAHTRQERAELRAQGVNEHHSRGLCPACYKAAFAAGTLVDHERLVRSRDEVLEEYARLGLRPGESRAARCRRLAPRMGMSYTALERALDRAGVAA